MSSSQNDDADELSGINQDIGLEQMWQTLARLSDKPVLVDPCAEDDGDSNLAPGVAFEPDSTSWGLITNPRAVLEVLDPENFLRSGLSEECQCRILDSLTTMVLSCQPNNAHALRDLLVQPVEYLCIPRDFFEKPGISEDGRLSKEALARQIQTQNDLNLYQQKIRARQKQIRLNSTSLIRRYAEKSSKLMRDQGEKREDDSDPEPHSAKAGENSEQNQGWQLEREHADLVLLLMWLGCKLASQELDKPAAKIAKLCGILSEGYQVRRD